MWNVRNAIGSGMTGYISLERDGRVAAVMTSGELEDLFWTLARHLSRTTDDDLLEAEAAELRKLTRPEGSPS